LSLWDRRYKNGNKYTKEARHCLRVHHEDKGPPIKLLNFAKYSNLGPLEPRKFGLA